MASYEESLVSISLDADDSIGIYTGVPGQPGSAAPNGGKQYHVLKLTGPHTVGVAAAADNPVGVLQNKPQTPGSAATVAIAGVSLVSADGAITAGDKVYASADGQGTGSGTGTPIGIAIDTATVAGQLIPVLLTL